MLKTVFHGSPKIVEKPTIFLSRATKDFGRGFYLAEDIDLGREWAVSYKKKGYLNKYLIELDGLNVLDTTLKPYNILNWIAFLLCYRVFPLSSEQSIKASEYLLEHYLLDIRDVDVLIGYRGDTSFFAFAKDFLEGRTSYLQLKKAIQKSGLGKQIVLISDITMNRLSFIECESVQYQSYYRLKQIRDERERAVYFNEKTKFNQKNDFYITDLLGEEVVINDKRL